MIRTGLAALGLLFAYGCALAQSDAVVEVKARGSFDDVKQMLVLAIENRGLVVNHQSPVGEMLERTGKDIGASKRIYERAELVEFCSATLSRQVMEADATATGVLSVRDRHLCSAGRARHGASGVSEAATGGTRARRAGARAGRPAPARYRAGGGSVGS